MTVAFATFHLRYDSNLAGSSTELLKQEIFASFFSVLKIQTCWREAASVEQYQRWYWLLFYYRKIIITQNDRLPSTNRLRLTTTNQTTVGWRLSISVLNLSEIVIRPFIIFQNLFYKTKLQNKNIPDDARQHVHARKNTGNKTFDQRNQIKDAGKR